MQRSRFETQVSNHDIRDFRDPAATGAHQQDRGTTMETKSMRLASWNWGGRDHVGTISPDGREATPLGVRDASLGVLPLIQALARGEPLPQPSGTRLPVEVDHPARAAAAPLAQPVLRRPQLPRACGGTGRLGVPRGHARERPLAHRLRQAGRMRGRPARCGAPALARRIGADRLRIRARRRHRPRRARHPARRARWTTCSATRSSTT